MPEDYTQHKNYRRIAKAIAYLTDSVEKQPSLKDLSCHMGLSEFYLQRLFSEWAGVSPKQFLQYITLEYAKQQLQHSSVMDAAYSTGLSSSSRLHDLMISCHSVTPGEYKRQGEGLRISYGVHPCRFGLCLIALTSRGICKLAFFDQDHERELVLKELQGEWPKAVINANDSATKLVCEQIFSAVGSDSKPLQLLLKGSPFQLQVWQALIRLQPGQLVSYQQLAHAVGNARAVRAVSTAVANNPIGLLVPCHRVIRSTGAFNQYRWGAIRKQAVIAWEAASASY